MPDVVRRNFRQYDKDNGQAGMIAPSCLGWAPNVLTLAVNQGRASRFVPSRNMTITKIAFALTTAAGSDDPVDVGIYSAAGAKLVSSGATLGVLNTAAGVKAITVTATTLVARTAYYVALSCGTIGTTAAVVMGANPSGLAAAQLFGSTLGLVEVDAASSVHPLPSTWTLGAISGVGLMAAVRES